MKTKPFSELGVGEPLQRAIGEMGFENPTPIQAAAIPAILEQSDLVGQSQTGTGKTAAFAIPVLEMTDPVRDRVQALVICPTRELAVQVTGEFIKLARFMKGVRIVPIYGGQPIQRQITHLRTPPQIVVGTPGRIIDHLYRGTLQLDHLERVVLDEADEMLNMGFREEIETILRFASGERKLQTILFSATFPPPIRGLVKEWLHEPAVIRMEGGTLAAERVRQVVVEARDSMRTEGISRLMDLHGYKKAIVFCNTRRGCDELVEEIRSRGYSSEVLHGELSQNARNRVMKRFRGEGIEILVATDVAARGLDVEDVDAVFNFDIPLDPENYVHRIGRTGRAGREGVAFTFASGRKGRSIRVIEKLLRQRLETIPLPSVQEVAESRINLLLQEVRGELEAGGLRPWIEQIESMLDGEDGEYTPIEVAAALLRMKEESKKVLETARETGRVQARPFKSRNPRRSSKPEPFYAHFVKKEKAGKSGEKRGGKRMRRH